jgi:hypothetical protein
LKPRRPEPKRRKPPRRNDFHCKSSHQLFNFPIRKTPIFHLKRKRVREGWINEEEI